MHRFGALFMRLARHNYFIEFFSLSHGDFYSKTAFVVNQVVQTFHLVKEYQTQSLHTHMFLVWLLLMLITVISWQICPRSSAIGCAKFTLTSLACVTFQRAVRYWSESMITLGFHLVISFSYVQLNKVFSSLIQQIWYLLLF